MFDWPDFLTLAGDLGTGATGTSVRVRVSEATSRSAVSRAYYAAFGHARAYAVQHLGFIPSNGPRDHGRLRAHFDARQMSDVADRLNLLRSWRNMCDYDGVEPNLGVIVGSALRNAEVVIGQL